MSGPGRSSDPVEVSPAERRAIVQDCLATFNRYLVNADHHPERFTECFTPDVIWLRPGGRMEGHEQMQAFIDATMAEQRRAGHDRDLTRHLLTTACVEVQGARSACGMFYALVYRVSGTGENQPQPMREPELLVEYRSHFVPVDGEWKIKQHEARHVLRQGVQN